MSVTEREIDHSARRKATTKINWAAFEYYTPLKMLRLHFMQHPSDPLPLATAARIAAMSPTSLARYFKHRTGISFKHWLDLSRIERAEAFLLKCDVPILQAALECGIHDATTFTRTFTRIKGITPSEFRRLYLPLSTNTDSYQIK